MINYSNTEIVRRDSIPNNFIGARYYKSNCVINNEIIRKHILDLNLEGRLRTKLVFDNLRVGERVYNVYNNCGFQCGSDMIKTNTYNYTIKEIDTTLYLKIITDLEDIIIIDEGRIVEIYHQLRHKDELILPTELILEYEK